MTTKMKNIVKQANKLDIRDEIQVLQLIFQDLFQKVNIPVDDKQFWQVLGQKNADKIWDNKGDDIYNELLKR